MPYDKTSQGQSNRNKDKLENKWKDDPRAAEFGKTNDPDYNPSLQNSGIDVGKPGNPNTPTPKNPEAGESDLHPLVASDDRLKASGRMQGGNPNEPVITRFPTSKPVGAQGSPDTVDISDAFDFLIGSTHEDLYGANDLEPGQGKLVPVQPGKTIDQTILEAQGKVYRLNQLWSVEALNDEGERILDSVVVEELKRNDDKTIQLDERKRPLVGANAGHIPRRIQLRQYVVKNVVADDDRISADGALIVRVF